MEQYLGPIQGIVIGFTLIAFRENISRWISNGFRKSPKEGGAIKPLNIDQAVTPTHIMIVGFISLFMAMLGFVAITL